jgi:hypothetical protein
MMAPEKRDVAWLGSPGGKLAKALESFVLANGDLHDALRRIDGSDRIEARAIEDRICGYGDAIISATAPLLIRLHKRHCAQLN